MSSREENSSDRPKQKRVKRRRVGRACDLCRVKKIRCDGEQRPGQPCANCAIYDEECTYVQAPPKRCSRPRGYVQRLEARVAEMEELLNTLCPGLDLSREMDEAMEESALLISSEFENDETNEHSGVGTSQSHYNDTFTYAIPPSLFSPSLYTKNPILSNGQHHHINARTRSLSTTTEPLSGLSSPTSPADEDADIDSSDDEVSARKAFKHLSLDPTNISSRRYFGKSSSVAALGKVLNMKCEYAREGGLPKVKRVTGSDIYALETGSMVADTFREREKLLPCNCPKFCMAHPWATPLLPSQPLMFPPADLIPTLVSHYFEFYNGYIPILHRPLFLQSLEAKRHLHDDDFGSVLLLVCALGARFCDDPRVLWREGDKEQGKDGSDDEMEVDDAGWHSAGWKWFIQVRLLRRAMVPPPGLFDLQIACLSAIYLRGSSTPEASRTVTGVGLRLAQDVGAHRKKTYSNMPLVEEELMKRAFWVLVWMDWSISCALGRPTGVHYEDFDLELPIECDDEYWIHSDPSLAFRQPPTKPSTVAFFNCALRLNQIQAFAMRTIYSTSKSKTLLGFVGPQWEERIVAELDSALNKWVDCVPPHLRWDPHNPEPLFLNQSATLYATYYALQISIHRPFIPSPRKPSHMPFPSLTICTNAARSCIHVLDIAHQKNGLSMYINLVALFTASIVLMLNMWGSSLESGRDATDVHKAMGILKLVEHRWHTAGRLRDMLCELAIVGNLPLPPDEVRSRIPRRASTTPASHHASTSRSQIATCSKPSRRATVACGSMASMKKPTVSTSATLPVRSDELGRLPLHQVFDSDPSSSCFEYDLSPSVFNPPRPVAPSDPQPSDPPLDPALDSVFTLPAFRRHPGLNNRLKPYAISETGHQTSSDVISTQPASANTETRNAESFMSQGGTAEGSVHALPQNHSEISSDTLSMWSNAPAGFEWDDWGNYITRCVASTDTNVPYTEANTYSFGRP